LQEAADADLLLHVVDAASPQRLEQTAEVERVLREIGADQVPQIVVYNKCDLIEASRLPRQRRDWCEREDGQSVRRVFVSALDRDGLDTLRDMLATAVGERLNTSHSTASPPAIRYIDPRAIEPSVQPKPTLDA
jgi:GTP-binding protein HflX